MTWNTARFPHAMKSSTVNLSLTPYSFGSMTEYFTRRDTLLTLREGVEGVDIWVRGLGDKGTFWRNNLEVIPLNTEWKKGPFPIQFFWGVPTINEKVKKNMAATPTMPKNQPVLEGFLLFLDLWVVRRSTAYVAQIHSIFHLFPKKVRQKGDMTGRQGTWGTFPKVRQKTPHSILL